MRLYNAAEVPIWPLPAPQLMKFTRPPEFLGVNRLSGNYHMGLERLLRVVTSTGQRNGGPGTYPRRPPIDRLGVGRCGPRRVSSPQLECSAPTYVPMACKRPGSSFALTRG